jgi:hypothetical protein
VSRSGSCIAFLLVAATWTISVSAAADKPARTTTAPNQAPPGYHDVKLSGGAVVRVADQGSTSGLKTAAAQDNGPYDPESANFSKTSSYASKSFDTGHASLSQNSSAEEARDGKHFLTQPYATGEYAGAGRTFKTVAYADASHPDADLTKSFVLSKDAAPGADQTFNTGRKSEFQDKNALIAQTAPKVDPFAAPADLTEKTFFDPTTLHVPHKSFTIDKSVSSDPNSEGTITDLPNRPLTVDEVRNLINHEQIPDLNSKAEAPSRALNDPNWTPPEVAPPALDDRPVRPGPTTESQGDDLPPPGMMSQPAQNSPSR